MATYIFVQISKFIRTLWLLALSEKHLNHREKNVYMVNRKVLFFFVQFLRKYFFHWNLTLTKMNATKGDQKWNQTKHDYTQKLWNRFKNAMNSEKRNSHETDFIQEILNLFSNFSIHIKKMNFLHISNGRFKM